MLVWLTDWQLAEDRLLFRVGERVEWMLYAADGDWTRRLFGDRLSIEWQFDTYGDAVDQPAVHVVGVVERLQRVRCRQEQTEEGIVPVRGAASLSDVSDTSSSWATSAPPRPSASAAPRPSASGAEVAVGAWYPAFTGEGEGDYGYVLTLRPA